MLISRSRYRWSRAGVVSAVQIACRMARWSASARAWLRVWVAERCWPSRSSTPASTASASPVVAAGAGWVPGPVGAAVVAGQLGGRARAGRGVGQFRGQR